MRNFRSWILRHPFLVGSVAGLIGGLIGTMIGTWGLRFNPRTELLDLPLAPRTAFEPRPILFTDWEIDRGRTLWIATEAQDDYLQLSSDPAWTSLDLREEVLENSEGYRWLETEAYSSPNSVDWRIVVMVFYQNRDWESWDEWFETSSLADYLNRVTVSFFDAEHRILVAPDGWVKLRLPLQTATRGKIVSLSLTSYEGVFKVRNITLVP